MSNILWPAFSIYIHSSDPVCKGGGTEQRGGDINILRGGGGGKLSQGVGALKRAGRLELPYELRHSFVLFTLNV